MSGRFPIQGGGTVHRIAAERAYRSYTKFYGSSQTLERLEERGGFGFTEFLALYHARPDVLGESFERSRNKVLTSDDLKMSLMKSADFKLD